MPQQNQGKQPVAQKQQNQPNPGSQKQSNQQNSRTQGTNSWNLTQFRSPGTIYLIQALNNKYLRQTNRGFILEDATADQVMSNPKFHYSFEVGPAKKAGVRHFLLKQNGDPIAFDVNNNSARIQIDQILAASFRLKLPGKGFLRCVGPSFEFSATEWDTFTMQDLTSPFQNLGSESCATQ